MRAHGVGAVCAQGNLDAYAWRPVRARRESEMKWLEKVALLEALTIRLGGLTLIMIWLVKKIIEEWHR